MLQKAILSIAVALLVCGAWALPQDEFVIQTPFMLRTISAGAGVLKTTKFEVNGEQVLLQPSVEFMLEFDVDGKFASMAPSDFEIKSVGSTQAQRGRLVEIQLASKRGEFPLVVLVRYLTHPDWPYIQKSVLIRPVRSVRGAVLKRIVIEDLVLKPDYAITPGGCGAVNAKSGNGLYFLSASLAGTERVGRFGGIVLAEDADVPVRDVYESGKAVVGAASGGVDGLCQAFRDYLWNNYCIARERKLSVDNCIDAGFELTDAKQRVRSLTTFAAKCSDLRKRNPDKALCLTLSRPVQMSDWHFLSVVDDIKVDLTALKPEDSAKLRESLLRVLPPATLSFSSPL